MQYSNLKLIIFKQFTEFMILLELTRNSDLGEQIFSDCIRPALYKTSITKGVTPSKIEKM